LFRVDGIFPTCLGALVIDPTIVRGLVRSFTHPRTTAAIVTRIWADAHVT
jgi:hypothetical protein